MHALGSSALRPIHLSPASQLGSHRCPSVLPRPVLNKAERPRQCRANEGYFITSQDKKLANVLAIYGQVDEGRLESTPADTGISVSTKQRSASFTPCCCQTISAIVPHGH
jgi:hypothetical protein